MVWFGLVWFGLVWFGLFFLYVFFFSLFLRFFQVEFHRSAKAIWEGLVPPLQILSPSPIGSLARTSVGPSVLTSDMNTKNHVNINNTNNSINNNNNDANNSNNNDNNSNNSNNDNCKTIDNTDLLLSEGTNFESV